MFVQDDPAASPAKLRSEVPSPPLSLTLFEVSPYPSRSLAGGVRKNTRACLPPVSLPPFFSHRFQTPQTISHGIISFQKQREGGSLDSQFGKSPPRSATQTNPSAQQMAESRTRRPPPFKAQGKQKAAATRPETHDVSCPRRELDERHSQERLGIFRLDEAGCRWGTTGRRGN